MSLGEANFEKQITKCTQALRVLEGKTDTVLHCVCVCVCVRVCAANMDAFLNQAPSQAVDYHSSACAQP